MIVSGTSLLPATPPIPTPPNPAESRRIPPNPAESRRIPPHPTPSHPIPPHPTLSQVQHKLTRARAAELLRMHQARVITRAFRHYNLRRRMLTQELTGATARTQLTATTDRMLAIHTRDRAPFVRGGGSSCVGAPSSCALFGDPMCVDPMCVDPDVRGSRCAWIRIGRRLPKQAKPRRRNVMASAEVLGEV